MPAYDSDRATPPAPFALVTVRNPDTRQSITAVPMLLDTGADVSLVPRPVAETLGAEQGEADGVRLVAFDGTVHTATTARLELHFFNKTFRGEFLLMDDTQGIIGRDILNLISLHLDGPRLTWDELP